MLVLTVLMLAVIGTFATERLTATVAYEWDPVEVDCIPHSVENCGLSGTIECKVTGVPDQLRENNNVANSCGQLMFRN